jgi:hypothetical protein
MILAKIKTNNEFELYCTGKDEFDIRNKVNLFLKDRFISESVIITNLDIIAYENNFMSKIKLLK